MNKLKQSYFIMIILLIFPLIFYPSPSLLYVKGYAENVKIGITWINGLVGASELIDIGYKQASEIGCQIEHREYRWDFLNYTLNPIYEWSNLYLARYPNINSSLAIGVISSNATALPIVYNFTKYESIPPSYNVRFNDTEVVKSLKKTVDDIMNITDLDYISFGNEINGFFASYYNATSNNLTNTIMLEDYADLCKQMYDYIKLHYATTKVLTIFKYQLTSDINNTKAIIDYFSDACDIYGVSFRIPTNDYGSLLQLSEIELLNRFSNFTSLTSKKVAITNIYTVSDSRAGGSEFYQANFVGYLFNLIKQYENSLEFICWYTIFDFPPGYLSTYYSPYFEVHATAGLMSLNGTPKMSYYKWVAEMRRAGRLPNYTLPWKIGIGVTILVLIFGFVLFTFIYEEIQLRKQEKGETKGARVDLKKENNFPSKSKKTIIEFSSEELSNESEINQTTNTDEK